MSNSQSQKIILTHQISNSKYNLIFDKLWEDVLETLNLPISAEVFNLIEKAGRIFVVGNGSSYPAANFLAKYLTFYQSKAAIFCLTGELLDNENFEKSDLIIMVSQGWGRGEAYLLTQKFAKLGIQMIVITGNPLRKISHYEDSTNLFAVEIKPNEEKIFCRPNSPLTSYLKICQISGIELEINKIEKIYTEIPNLEFAESITKIQKAEKVVILSTSLALCTCQNLALAMREGSGINAEVSEIESYGHGWYTTDQNNPKTLYLLVSHRNYPHSLFAKSRIENLVKNGNCDFLELESEYGLVYGNIWTLILTAKLISELNKNTNFDMNNPKGMESNRNFHEIFEQKK